MEVEDMHPLRRKHITDIIPTLKCFQFCGCLKKKKDFRVLLREAIVNELCTKYHPEHPVPVIPENEKENDEHPFMIAGYGVNSFFDIMKRLIFLFLVITLITFPMMMIYSKNTNQGIKGLDKVSWKTNFNAFTLGNMGGA